MSWRFERRGIEPAAQLAIRQRHRSGLPHFMTLVSIPANPVPENAVSGSLKTSDGVSLRYARWAPPPGRKGTVCLFQGRAEFIEKYFETVRDLRTRGFAVATLDWRGQGLSDRPLRDQRKGHVGNYSEYGADLEAFMREVVLPDCPPPYFAIAQSMGGAVLIRAAREGRRWFDRIVLAAPMIALASMQLSSLEKTMVRVLRSVGLGSAYPPSGTSRVPLQRPFASNQVTSDPVRFARNMAVLEAEPALLLGPPTIAWLDSTLRVTADFADPSYPSNIRQPILILAAGQDDVVSTTAIEVFAIDLRAGSHLIIPGSRHEILMEQDRLRAQFWAAFDAFVPGTPLY
jgi:lysophospholipase